RRASDIGQRQCDLLRQIRQHHGIGRVSNANSRYGSHGGPFLRGCSWSFTRRPTIRQASGEGPPPQIPRRPGQPPAHPPDPIPPATPYSSDGKIASHNAGGKHGPTGCGRSAPSWTAPAPAHSPLASTFGRTAGGAALRSRGKHALGAAGQHG